MDANQKKMLKELEPGDLILLSNYKEYYFVQTKGDRIVCKTMQGNNIAVTKGEFRQRIQRNADPYYAGIRSSLQSLRNGDTIECTDGTYVFVKMKKDKFLATDFNEVYQFPFDMFVKVVERLGPDSELAKKKKRIRSYFGKQILTSWGPAAVKGFNSYETHVILYEHADERFDLKLDDFISELEDNN
ncbi:hypothetical protein SAMN04487897_10998 [Paenibacillus sp. yr247]|uniref:hypothetical protein n=1 Tax=Paenibacillus sp. yr247 TaxID=1761880 RepID=UPI00088A4E61|nr:hypothetical protein [Paenibacillus sp. yr247]SDO17348.1 hypothetical protein SAMN04487897_10998 [Paenibacillus sp. yr247]